MLYFKAYLKKHQQKQAHQMKMLNQVYHELISKENIKQKYENTLIYAKSEIRQMAAKTRDLSH